MLYKFTKVKPQFEKLWKDINEVFQKPLYGCTVETVRFTMLVYISVGEFNDTKKLMKSGITEDEFKAITKYHPHILSKMEILYTHLIPNPVNLPLTILLYLMHNSLAGTYVNIAGTNTASSDELDLCFRKGENSIVEILANPNIVHDNLLKYFTYDDDLAAIPIYSQSDLEDYILNSHLVGNTTLPKFVYDIEANILSTASLSTEDIQLEPLEGFEMETDNTYTSTDAYKPRSIKVSGDRATIGHINWAHNVVGDNWKELTAEQYKAVSTMDCNNSDSITTTKRCRALRYDKKTNHIDLTVLNTPNFNYSANTVLLRYKEI